MKMLPASTIKRIHVNRQVLARNLKTGRNDRAITVQTSKGPLQGYQVEVYGKTRVVQARPGGPKPLKCGARVWVETRSAVVIS